jgi:tetratricopeptide (TPR) repeat protein
MMPQRDQATRRVIIPLALAVVFISTGCVKPRKTTAIGSGVGGAIGAGLGAIIGNQSGNAGSGLAIGAGTGAAVGALVGNALQAEQERNTAQDEAIKRQEQVIKAQRNEINELRTIRGDDSYALNSSAVNSTPRYRLRGTTTDPESPEVARQRAKLQQRGPTPNGATAAHSYPAFSKSVTTPKLENSQTAKYSPPPKVKLPDARTAVGVPSQEPRQLARYEIGSESADKAAPKAGAVTATTTLSKPVVTSSITPDVSKASPSGLSESDLPTQANAPEATAKVAAAPVVNTQTKECKAALAERDLAVEASDNSDKLFHLRRALRLCPNSAPLHHELGKVYASMQRAKDAESEFQQALSIDPSFSAAKKELGALLKDEVHF